MGAGPSLEPCHEPHRQAAQDGTATDPLRRKSHWLKCRRAKVYTRREMVELPAMHSWKLPSSGPSFYKSELLSHHPCCKWRRCDVLLSCASRAGGRVHGPGDWCLGPEGSCSASGGSRGCGTPTSAWLGRHDVILSRSSSGMFSQSSFNCPAYLRG